jgi:hypothetical protein
MEFDYDRDLITLDATDNSLVEYALKFHALPHLDSSQKNAAGLVQFFREDNNPERAAVWTSNEAHFRETADNVERFLRRRAAAINHGIAVSVARKAAVRNLREDGLPLPEDAEWGLFEGTRQRFYVLAHEGGWAVVTPFEDRYGDQRGRVAATFRAVTDSDGGVSISVDVRPEHAHRARELMIEAMDHHLDNPPSED